MSSMFFLPFLKQDFDIANFFGWVYNKTLFLKQIFYFVLYIINKNLIYSKMGKKILNYQLAKLIDRWVDL